MGPHFRAAAGFLLPFELFRARDAPSRPSRAAKQDAAAAAVESDAPAGAAGGTDWINRLVAGMT